MRIEALLSDEQWEKIQALCSGKQCDRGVTAGDNRKFVEAVLWHARYGDAWRRLPGVFGSWHAIYMRHNRWAKKGIWAEIIAALNDAGDCEALVCDLESVLPKPHLKRRCVANAED